MLAGVTTLSVRYPARPRGTAIGVTAAGLVSGPEQPAPAAAPPTTDGRVSVYELARALKAGAATSTSAPPTTARGRAPANASGSGTTTTTSTAPATMAAGVGASTTTTTTPLT